MKTVGRIVISIGLLAAAIAWMFAYRPASAAATLPLTISAAELNVRQGPGTIYAISTVLTAGTQAHALGRDATGAWYEIQLADGSTGWVSAEFVALNGDAGALPWVPAQASAAPATNAAAATGGHIVFQTSSGGAIYIMNPDGSGLRYLTTGMDPALSPDGRQVAFTRWDGTSNGVQGGVWLINIDGTGERQLLGQVNQPKSPSWSPDGKQIVINMQQGGTVAPVRQTITVKPGSRPAIPPGAYDITRSGNTISFTAPADPHWGLRLINVADGTFQDLPRSTYSFAPTWDPADPNVIVYHGQQGLMAINLAQNTATPLTTSAVQRSPVFSPDGSKIALSYQQDTHWEVHLINANGSGDTRLTETPLTALVDMELAGKQPVQWNNAAPAWSPDGSQIVFLTDRNGQWEIWAMNADGSGQHPLLAGSQAAALNIQYNGVDERVLSWR